MKTISILAFSYSLFFATASISAESCTIAFPQINDLIAKVNLALASEKLGIASDMAIDMKDIAKDIRGICDTCMCDDAYESTELILDNADDVYLADTIEEAKEYLIELKANAQLTIAGLKQCDLSK